MRIPFLTLIISLFLTSFSSAQNFEKIVLDRTDELGGYYLALKPYSPIKGTLILFPTRGHYPENIFIGSKLQNHSWANGILTIAVSAGKSFYADSTSIKNLNHTIKDVIERFEVNPKNIVIGGFGGGGMIGLRYAEYCYEKPDDFPILPRAVFAVDPAVDLINLWHSFQRELKNGISETGIKEAQYVLEQLKNEIGDIEQNFETYKQLTPFHSKSTEIGNEKYLKNVPVRLYYDVDLEWYLENKMRSAYDLNFLDGSELIKRLLLLGNNNAEFMQATGKGFSFNGQRHPHSWSIIDEIEFMIWLNSLFEENK